MTGDDDIKVGDLIRWAGGGVWLPSDTDSEIGLVINKQVNRSPGMDSIEVMWANGEIDSTFAKWLQKVNP